jgi:hypothetical protein
MRLDARTGDTGWYVFDCAKCRPVEEVVWCDEETARWGQVLRDVPFVSHGTRLPFDALLVRQEQRIRIYPERRLVLFNEVELDDEDTAITTTEEHAC